MYSNVDLISNGKLNNYPKNINIDALKIKHKRELSNAIKNNEIVFENVVTSVLNDLVDWSRVEGIKSVDDLTYPDRMKLFLWEIVNTRDTDEFTVSFECPECKSKSTNKFSIINDIQEVKLLKKIEDRIIREKKIKNNKLVDDPDGRVLLILRMPSSGDTFNLDRKIIEFKENILNKIKIIKKEENDILESIQKETKRKNYYIMTSNQQMKHEESISLCDNNINELYKRLNELRTEEYTKISSEEINKILKDNFLESFDPDLITTRDDLFFYSEINELLSYYSTIKDNDREILEYISYMDNFDEIIIKDIKNFIEEIAHGFDNNIKLKCGKCKQIFDEKIVFKPSFFFQMMD
jgi:uncharacterized C2H2 Zn-finger protein